MTVSGSGLSPESQHHPDVLERDPGDALFCPEKSIYCIFRGSLQTVHLLGQFPSAVELATSELDAFGKGLLVRQ